MKQLVLMRLDEGKDQTLGRLLLFNGLDLAFHCVTLELPWKDNRRRISCIPKGIYEDVRPFDSEKLGQVLAINDVPDRSEIRIHSGNYASQIEGCILVGRDFADLNRDGHLDVTFSKATLQALLAHIQEPVKLVIQGFLR